MPEPSSKIHRPPDNYINEAGSRQGRGIPSHCPAIGGISRKRAAGPPLAETTPLIKHKDPLHGVTLKMILADLEARYGWRGLGENIALRCFTNNPSLTSSLKFLRKTPWARKKVEGFYLRALKTR